MNEEQTIQYQAPSRKGILAGTAVAFVIGIVLLVTIILPVEYDLDPTGIGSTLGLTAIASANTSRAAPTMMLTAEVIEGDEENGTETYTVPDPYGLPQVTPGSEKYAKNSETIFRSETIEIPLQADEELEYKFQMHKGQVLVYAWDSGNADVYFEFHAEPTEGEYPEGYYMSYQIGDPATGANGSLAAPFTGNHGWYFLNLTGDPVTIRLKVSGYYQSHGRLH